MLRPHGDAAPGSAFDRVAHHRLVDGADLLHVERPIGEPLAVEHQEGVQHPVDAAIRDPRRLELLANHSPDAQRPTLKKRELVGIEELAVAGREPQASVATAVEDESEEGEQPRVGAVPLVHHVRVAAGI